jgi:hypothetical protein
LPGTERKGERAVRSRGVVEKKKKRGEEKKK